MENPHRGSLYGAGPLRSREVRFSRAVSSSDEIQLRIDPMHADLDEEITGIHQKITQLKSVAQEIGSEAKFQNDFITQLDLLKDGSDFRGLEIHGSQILIGSSD